MTHPYMYHVDVRDVSGFYLGALAHVLRDRHLHDGSCDLPTMRDDELAEVKPDLEPPSVVVRSLRIPLTIWTICERAPGTILWSERDCVVVTCIDLHVLLDGGYVVLYNQDPFIDDKRAWVTDFISHNRRDQ